MRILIVLAITLLFFGCKSPKESSDSVDDFNTFLGASQSKVLDKTIISFERFLEVNYGSEKSSELRLKAFLESIIFMNQQSSWTFDLENNKILLSEWESSGLRREIELYGYEDYSPTCDIFGLLPHDTIDHSNSDTIKFGTMEYALAEEDLLPMSPEDSLKYIEDTARANSKIRKIMAHRDSILNFNRFGKFLYGLNKYSKRGALIVSYTDLKLSSNNVSPSLTAEAFLEYSNYKDPFFLRLTVCELYIKLIRWDINKT